jgi:hypothetical protein
MLHAYQVEGHGCHRVAAAHRRLMLGRRMRATSPNGRFADGATPSKFYHGRAVACQGFTMLLQVAVLMCGCDQGSTLVSRWAIQHHSRAQLLTEPRFACVHESSALYLGALLVGWLSTLRRYPQR